MRGVSQVKRLSLVCFRVLSHDVDFAPSQPSKPNIKKLSSSSVQVSSKVVPNDGSDIEKFTIQVYKALDPSNRRVIVVEAQRQELEFTVEGLEPDTQYQFEICAINSVGSSIPSEPSDSVNVGMSFKPKR